VGVVTRHFTHNEAIDRVARFTDGMFQPSSDWVYVNALTPIPGTCLRCGHDTCHPRLADLQQGKGFCFRCGHAKTGKARRIPHDEARDRIEELTSGKFEPDDDWEYENVFAPIPGRCLECGAADCLTNLHELQRRGNHCRRCSQTKETERRRIPVDEVLERIEAATRGMFEPDPGWVYVNSKTPIPGRCLTCGYEKCGPTLNNLSSGIGHCVRCGGGGSFDVEKPGWVYLLHHKAERLLKVGVMNEGSLRVENFESVGWVQVDAQYFRDGALCWDLEVDLHGSLRGLLASVGGQDVAGFPERCEHASSKHGGASEMYPFEVFGGSVPETLAGLVEVLDA
jgi:hypothetical protein